MKKYLVKEIYEDQFDEDGNYAGRNLLERKILFQVDSNQRPRGDFLILECEDSIKHPFISTDEDGNLILIEDPTKALQDEIAIKYDEMVSDIYAQMEAVFGTKNDISATAFAATWEAMKKRPTAYIDIDLNLNSEAEVIAYADAKLNAADNYGIYRLKRIQQFEAEKAAILS